MAFSTAKFFLILFFLLCVHLLLIKIYLTKNDEIVISIPTILKKTQHLGVSYAPSLSCQIWRNIYC